MEYIPYFFVYLTKAYRSVHSLGVYKDYFVAGNGFLIAFAIALVIPIIITSIFYFGFGRKSLKSCSNAVWIGGLIVCVSLCFAGTYYSTGVTSMTSKGKGKWGIVKVLNEKQKKVSQTDKDKLNDLQRLKTVFKKPLRKSAPIRTLCIENSILGGLLFLFFSWIIRRSMLPVTNFALPYPTFWPVKRKIKK